MLPRKLHLEQINRFHDAYLNLDKEIQNEVDKEKKYELLKKNVELIRFWSEVDDFFEFKVMQKLDDLSL
jgi:prophage maintenance system killer protein